MFPGLRVIVNNTRSAEIERILENTEDNVVLGCDWSLPVGFIERLVDAHGDGRLVFGSNSPLHYYQSSLLRIQMADIPLSSRRMILSGNIDHMLRG